MTTKLDQFLEQAAYNPVSGYRNDGSPVLVDQVWNALEQSSTFEEMMEILFPVSMERQDRIDVDFEGDGSSWFNDRKTRFFSAA
jgi:hypothetical protein